MFLTNIKWNILEIFFKILLNYFCNWTKRRIIVRLKKDFFLKKIPFTSPQDKPHQKRITTKEKIDNFIAIPPLPPNLRTFLHSLHHNNYAVKLSSVMSLKNASGQTRKWLRTNKVINFEGRKLFSTLFFRSFFNPLKSRANFKCLLRLSKLHIFLFLSSSNFLRNY